MDHPEPWPLRHLVLRTPRLELRPDDDAGLLELVDEAYRGVHPPDWMPFLVPWTDADPRDLGRRVLQHYWGVRSRLAPERWSINFLVRYEGRMIGMQEMSGADFRILREVETGSWIGMRHQGRGHGTEMRAAVLAFAFDHLGAVRARSAAFTDNTASHRVSERLGYRRDGSMWVARRGEPAEDVRLVLTPEDFVRPEWTLRIEGVAGCLPVLGAD
ncbi:RimJ/RimL family protein N-acetyltransferase [Pseudonocardia hierapolitana]|uniref:RimJ/RimL family protein N-acetyltransferase n=1 Tax=Pseudonocardia hierapolitana TaxID=1128676 RepID=A0A561SR52_9PSEU|nr:GNAT family protein [Pseudonocardia hierapolitana]TWF77344.1 RimJ/RimL family protein N-acetyltransferase [Pseudonocardia hierapolitana]